MNKIPSQAHKPISWYHLGVNFKISKEHPCPFYTGVPRGFFKFFLTVHPKKSRQNSHPISQNLKIQILNPQKGLPTGIPLTQYPTRTPRNFFQCTVCKNLYVNQQYTVEWQMYLQEDIQSRLSFPFLFDLFYCYWSSHCKPLYNKLWYMVRPSKHHLPKRGKVWIKIVKSHCVIVYPRLLLKRPLPPSPVINHPKNSLIHL